jgi:hypothetical protein
MTEFCGNGRTKVPRGVHFTDEIGVSRRRWEGGGEVLWVKSRQQSTRRDVIVEYGGDENWISRRHLVVLRAPSGSSFLAFSVSLSAPP